MPHIWLFVFRGLLVNVCDLGEIEHGYQQVGQQLAQLGSANIYLFASPMHQCSKHIAATTEEHHHAK